MRNEEEKNFLKKSVCMGFPKKFRKEIKDEV